MDADQCAAKVLVVDDDQGTCKVLEKALGKIGAEVRVCATGNDGLSQARQFVPDIVLLDYMLPKMDGLKVLRFLKGDARQKARVVLMSASAEGGLREEATQAGADGVLDKPLDISKVTEMVLEFMS